MKTHPPSDLSEVASLTVPTSAIEPRRIFEIKLAQPLPSLSATNEKPVKTELFRLLMLSRSERPKTQVKTQVKTQKSHRQNSPSIVKYS